MSEPPFPPRILAHKPFSAGHSSLYGPSILHMLLAAVHSRVVNEFMVTYLLTYLLTPWCRVLLEKPAASQEIPHISRNPKVHYRTHKRPPTVSILGQPNPVHIPTSHFLEIHPNIIHPSTPRSPQWSPSIKFPHQDPIHPPLLTHTCHMPSPSH